MEDGTELSTEDGENRGSTSQAALARPKIVTSEQSDHLTVGEPTETIGHGLAPYYTRKIEDISLTLVKK